MKKVFSLMAVLIISVSALIISASAATTSGTCGATTWTLDDQGTLTINGNSAFSAVKSVIVP